MSPPIFPPEELQQIVQEVATLLKERKETISVAETVRPPSPTQSHLLTTPTRQQAVSSLQHSSPSPAHRPTIAAVLPCTHSSHESHTAAGHRKPSNPTAAQPLPSSLASPSTRVRHWEARIPSARAEPQGRQGERLVTAHQAT